MTAIVDQPPPIATDRRPSWEIVIAYVEQTARDSGYAPSGVTALVLADMRARDAIGRDRYGTPLTSGNGRDHLVDAMQELLDACAYFATELDEHGVGPATMITASRFPDAGKRWRLHCVQQLFAQQVRAAIQLRGLIEERDAS